METKVFTPKQLWESYNVNKLHLIKEKIGSVEFDDYTKCKYTYVVDSLDDGEILGYCQFLYPKNSKGPFPVIVVADDYFDTFKDSCLFFVKNGFCVVLFDYTGKRDGKVNYTKYPKSLDYCNYEKAGSHLYEASPSIKESCIYTWVKVTRRLISLVVSDEKLNSEQISVLGYLDGANIMWQVAAFDERVKTFIAIANAGRQRSSLESTSDAHERFLIAGSPQSYAKFVNIPTLYVSSTNNPYTPLNKLEDTLSRMPKDTKIESCITKGNDTNYEKEARSTILSWLKCFVVSPTVICATGPQISFSTKSEKIRFKVEVNTGIEILDASILITSDNDDPAFRNWSKVKLNINKSGTATYDYCPVDKNDSLIVFANVTYKCGCMFSSNILSIAVSKLKDITPLGYTKTRVIYNRQMGTDPFLVENVNILHEETDLVLTLGPSNIYGISVNSGNLVTYSIGDREKIGNKGYLLQFNAYSPVAKTSRVILTVQNSSRAPKEYFYDFVLEDEEEWQQIYIEAQDFKDINLIPLDSWANIKKLSFANAEGVIFNNIIWV